MKKHIMPFITVLLFMAASCKKDDNAVQKQQVSKLIQSNIAGVSGPTSGTVNQGLTFSLVWLNTNGTTKFDHVQDSTSDNILFIKLFALTNAADTSSVAINNVKPVSYTFKATTPGTYYLKFYKADNSDKTAIIDTLFIK